MNQQEVLIALRNWVVGRSRIVKGTIALTSEDLGSLIIVDSTSSVTLTLPDLRLTPFDWGRIQIKNVNSGTVTVAAVSGQYIESATSFQLAQYEGCELFEYKGKWYHEIITPTKGLSAAALAGITGDITISGSGVSAIGDGKVLSRMLADEAFDDVTGDVTFNNNKATSIGSGKVVNAMLASDINKIIAASASSTTDPEDNIAALSSAITLANAIKASIVSHFANDTRHTTGQQDTTSVGSDASDLASLVALTGVMMALYVDHNADAILEGEWAYHSEQATTKALASEVPPVTLAEAVVCLNDLKAKFNDHEDETTGHASEASVVADQVSESDAAAGDTNRVAISGVLAGDVAFWGIEDDGTNDVTRVSATAGAGYVDFEFSGDPGDDVDFWYLVIRLAS